MLMFFHSPGTCSMGIHILLEEVGATYESHSLNLLKGEQNSPDYRAVNPKGKVPALLRSDGTLLTEWPAIATWLALAAPEMNLLPMEREALARTLENVDYIVATLHMQGFTRMWRPDHFTSREEDKAGVRATGRRIFDGGLAEFNEKLQRSDYLGGTSPSIADFALFYLEHWKTYRLKEDLPSGLAAHNIRMKARPSVQKVLRDEGFAE